MKSDQINELAAALAKAQARIGGVSRSADNPFFKSKYADLAAYLDVIRAPLSENGLAVSQLVSTAPNQVVVTTMLMHASGQWISSDLAMTPKDASPQAAGSAITYARRYALAAIVCAASDDDDGNAASIPQRPPQAQARPQQRPQQAPPIGGPQR